MSAICSYGCEQRRLGANLTYTSKAKETACVPVARRITCISVARYKTYPNLPSFHDSIIFTFSLLKPSNSCSPDTSQTQADRYSISLNHVSMPSLNHKESAWTLSSCSSAASMGNQIDILVLSDEFPATIHEPNWLQPPLTALDSEGLKTRKEYADRVRKRDRDISARLYRFTLELGEKCHRVLKGRSKTQARVDDLNTIKVNDAILQNR